MRSEADVGSCACQDRWFGWGIDSVELVAFFVGGRDGQLREAALQEDCKTTLVPAIGSFITFQRFLFSPDANVGGPAPPADLRCVAWSYTRLSEAYRQTFPPETI